MASILAHILAVAKAGPFIDSGWRYIGGGAIVFHAIKTTLFGKTIRTMEYPDGDLMTLSIRWNTIKTVKSAIIKAQTPIFPGVEMEESFIKTLAIWTPPGFTEEIKSSKDLKRVQDGGWILWSRALDSIPNRNVSLTPPETTQSISDAAIRFIQELSNSKNADEYLPPIMVDPLIDLLIDNDQAVQCLYRNFKDNPKLFKKFSHRLLVRRQLISITM